MKKLKQIILITGFTLVLVGSVTAFGRGVTDGGGADYSDSGKLLDLIQVGPAIVDPRNHFKSIIDSESYKDAIGNIRSLLPDFADDLERVYSEKHWYLTEASIPLLVDEDPQARVVTGKLTRTIRQSSSNVLVSPEFVTLPASVEMQAYGLLHEGVRFLSSRISFGSHEDRIKLITSEIVHWRINQRSAAKLKSILADYGLGLYFTKSEKDAVSQMIRKIYDELCGGKITLKRNSKEAVQLINLLDEVGFISSSNQIFFHNFPGVENFKIANSLYHSLNRDTNGDSRDMIYERDKFCDNVDTKTNWFKTKAMKLQESSSFFEK